MIRSDREIADRASQLAILDACDVCRIAVNGDDGFPYIVPLNFGVDAEDFPWSTKLVPATTVWRLKVESMTGKFRDNVHPGETRWTPPAGWNGFDKL